jgi:hypothetical protein
MDKELYDLKKDLASDIQMVPVFVENKSSHKLCYELFKTQYNVLCNLFVDRVLKVQSLDNLSIKSDSIFGDMIEAEKDVALCYYSYMIEILEYYLSIL